MSHSVIPPVRASSSIRRCPTMPLPITTRLWRTARSATEVSIAGHEQHGYELTGLNAATVGHEGQPLCLGHGRQLMAALTGYRGDLHRSVVGRGHGNPYE